MLKDYYNILKGIINQDLSITPIDIKQSINMITPIHLNQTLKISKIEISSFYAGHVLGSIMILFKYN